MLTLGGSLGKLRAFPKIRTQGRVRKVVKYCFELVTEPDRQVFLKRLAELGEKGYRAVGFQSHRPVQGKDISVTQAEPQWVALMEKHSS